MAVVVGPVALERELDLQSLPGPLTQLLSGQVGLLRVLTPVGMEAHLRLAQSHLQAVVVEVELDKLVALGVAADFMELREAPVIHQAPPHLKVIMEAGIAAPDMEPEEVVAELPLLVKLLGLLAKTLGMEELVPHHQ